MITLAFDDGYKNHADVAAKILKQYDFVGTFYITTRNIGRDNFLSSTELKELRQSGHEIGSHSMAHPNLVFTFPGKAKKEIFESKRMLESFDLDIKTFGYPYGWYSPYIQKLVKQAGYIGARAFRPFGFCNDKDTDRYALRTTAVLRNTGLVQVKKWIDEAIAKDKWLIITFHDIAAHPTYWGCTEEMLEAVCAYLKEKQEKPILIKEGILKLYG